MKQKEIKEVRLRFQQNLPIDETCVPEVILDSWHRSRAYGLKPDVADKTVLSPNVLQQRIRLRHNFCEAAFPTMDDLFQFTKGSNFIVSLSDEDGYLLRIIGDDDIINIAKCNDLVEGCNRSEQRLGTNGIGTALAIKAPIQVFGEEHYYSLHHNWVCSGAPVFRPDGDLAGVFCLIGTADSVSLHTLGMAVAAAGAITRELKMKETYDALNLTQKDLNLIIETWPSGILLLDNDSRIRQANTRAAKMLMTQCSNLIGRYLQEVIGPGIVEDADLRMGINNRHITVERGRQTVRLSVSVQTTHDSDYLVVFEKVEALHRKVNYIIGSDAHFTFDDIIGSSPALKNTIQIARIAAQNNSSVLLTGESGTGKELFAQAIHNASNRKGEPFVAINCGALPKSLIESELFGYEGGSFTGAKRDGCAGKFELANGGTIFLDEVGDMPFEVQISLLRVLQSREIYRIGSRKAIKIDVRVISATNQDLSAAIKNNAFRSDLYYRLNVFEINVPSLHMRTGDIRGLADYFLEKYASDRPAQSVEGFSEDAYSLMEQYTWPGNVRELENAVERAVYITKTNWIGQNCFSLVPLQSLNMPENPEGVIEIPEPAGVFQPVDSTLPAQSRPTPPPGEESGAFSITENEQRLVENALLSSGGNVQKAAELLGISRRTMYRKMEKYGVDYNGIRCQNRG